MIEKIYGSRYIYRGKELLTWRDKIAIGVAGRGKAQTQKQPSLMAHYATIHQRAKNLAKIAAAWQSHINYRRKG